jgi:hypothetical protein
VKLEWMGLANSAENQQGLLYMLGGGWDTITVQAPIEGAPEGVFAFIQGTLVIRLLLDVTETDKAHDISLEIVDEDGGQLLKAQMKAHIARTGGLPIGWDQGVNFVFSLTGVPLPGPGNYTINLSVDSDFLGDRPFRVLKAY